MPWTRHDAVLDVAVTQRTRLVQTKIINGKEAFVQSEKRNMATADDNHATLARDKVLNPAHGDEVSHSLRPFVPDDSLARSGSQCRFSTFGAAHVDNLDWLPDLQQFEGICVVVDVGNRLSGDLDNHVTLL